MSPARIGRQRGMALMSSILLLVIITLLALSMFRSFGTQEKIAGNVREKERALHAANSAQEYAEWWLLQGNNSAAGAITCGTGSQPASIASGQICSFAQQPQSHPAGMNLTSGFPWPIQTTYLPNLMLLAGQPLVPGNPPYFNTPAFYITDIGKAADAEGEAYQIDAYGYGAAANTVAVVESTYEVQQGVVNRGGL